MAANGNGRTRLAQMLYLWRTVHRLSLRDVAAETDISNVTIMRIEHGHSMDMETFLKLMAWLTAEIGAPARSRAT